MLCCPGASPTDRANGQTARGEALGGPADRNSGGDRQATERIDVVNLQVEAWKELASALGVSFSYFDLKNRGGGP
jgi:hypothetical protein